LDGFVSNRSHLAYIIETSTLEVIVDVPLVGLILLKSLYWDGTIWWGEKGLQSESVRYMLWVLRHNTSSF